MRGLGVFSFFCWVLYACCYSNTFVPFQIRDGTYLPGTTGIMNDEYLGGYSTPTAAIYTCPNSAYRYMAVSTELVYSFLRSIIWYSYIRHEEGVPLTKACTTHTWYILRVQLVVPKCPLLLLGGTPGRVWFAALRYWRLTTGNWATTRSSDCTYLSPLHCCLPLHRCTTLAPNFGCFVDGPYICCWVFLPALLEPLCFSL